MGRLSNEGTYEPVQVENDLIGHGFMDAVLDVRRTVHGAQLSGDVPVRYSGHTYMREDREFMFVLANSGSGFHIRSAQLMSVKPRAVSDCE